MFICFSGPRKLYQFDVTDPYFVVKDNETLLKAAFTMKRIPSYFVLTAYIPSASLIVMSIFTLYMDSENGVSVSLVLTSLLCLYTLFQSALGEVTKTAYLKNMDFWYILCLISLVVMFLSIISWEWTRKQPIIKKIHQWLIPTTLVLCILAYISQAIGISNWSWKSFYHSKCLFLKCSSNCSW